MQTETKRCTGRTACSTGILKPAMIVAFLMMAASALAQDVIVTVTKVKQTLPPSVAEIIDHPNRVVSITLQNTTPQQMKVYLKLSLTSDYAPEGVPLSLHTEDRSTRRPCITLGPNEMRRLTNITDISDHFSGRLTTNVTENVMNIMRIPEGMYSMCLEVYPWRETVVDDGAPMSRDCAQYTVCYSASAPELITPIMVVNDNVSSVRQLQGTSKNSKVTSKTNIGISTINNRSTLPERSNPNSNMVEPSRLINIRWTGAITNCPQASQFNYTLKIVRVPQGVSPEYAIDHAPVFFLKNCGVNNYCQIDTLRNLNFPFERGATYAMQVEASVRGRDNTLEIANNGKSQVMTFSWGEPEYPVGDNTAQENRSTNESSNSSNKDSIIASFRQSYVVYPYRDAEAYNAVLAKFSNESSKVPAEDQEVQVRFGGTYDKHIVNPQKPFDIKWMPVRGKNLKHVRYDISLYEDHGALSDINTRTPMFSKTHNATATGDDYLTDSDPISLDNPDWGETLVAGKKYLVRVTAEASYRYYDYEVNKTVHYVNGIEADTESDTVKTERNDKVTYTSTMNFQWGVDSALLDRVLPPQFTGPINRSTDNWDDTAFMHFEPTVESLWHLDDFNLSWKKASNLDIKDEDSALYNLYIYEASKGKDIKDIVKGSARFHKDSIDGLMLKNDILDSLKENQIYVARVKVIIPDTSTYYMCNHGWSHPIAFTLKKDANDYSTAVDVTNACFPNDTAKLNKKDLISPKVDSLVNNRVKLKMGRFNLVVQNAKRNGNEYDGNGYVEWTPVAGYGCGIKVRFKGVKINKDLQIVSGTAHSITQDSNNYLNLNMGDNKYGAGFDMYSDKGMQMLNQYAGTLGSTGNEVKKWYDIINRSANPISQITHSIIEGGGASWVVTTPIRVSSDMLGGESAQNLSLAVNDAFFSPVTAQMNMLAIYSSHEDNLYLPFLVTNVCMEPEKFISDSIGTVYMFMAQDMEVPLSDGYSMTFKRPTSLSDMSNGTHIALDTGGFKEIAVDAEITLGTKDQPGNKILAVDIKQNGIVKPDKPVKAYFYTKFKSWSDWVVKLGMDPFTVVGCEDFAFVPTGDGIWYDHSRNETPDAIKLPENYMPVLQKKKEWRGFYMDKFAVFLPSDISNTFIDLAGEEAVKQETKYVKYSYGVNGQIKDSTEVIPEGSRINFTASELILDSCGISFAVSANNLLHLETKNGGGWAFSLDTVGIRFLKSSFKEGRLAGKMKIPLFSGNMKYHCSLGTDSIDFAITPNDALQLDLFLAKVELNKKSTHFRIVHDFGGNTYKTDMEGMTEYTYLNQDATTRVDLTLNGKVTIDFRKFKVPVDLPGIKFENMYMRNFTSKTVTYGKTKVKSYTMTDGLEFNIGNWSKASPQKYVGVDYTDCNVPYPVPEEGDKESKEPKVSGTIGGFSYNIMEIKPIMEPAGKPNTKKFGLEFGGSMSLGIGQDQSIGASLGFGISCDVNTNAKDFSISNWEGYFDSARVTTNVGPLGIDGFISHSRQDEVFGNCWKGMLDVTIMDVVKVKMGAGFGTKQRIVKVGDTTSFDWWYLEGAAEVPSGGIPLGPLSINGFGGAFAYNMQPKQQLANMTSKDLMGGNSLCDNMVSNDGSNYTPQYDAWIARAGVSLILTGSESTLNANGILGLRIANGHFSGVSMQVDAKMLSSYDTVDKEGSNAALTVGAFIDYDRGEQKGDWKLNFAANVKADINLTSLIKGDSLGNSIAAVYSYPTSSTEAAKGGKSEGMSSSWLEKKIQDSKDYANEEEKIKNASSGTGVEGSASLQIPIDFYVKNYPKGQKSPNNNKQYEWFFAVGRPNKEDRATFSASMDLVIAKASTEWTAYIMTGNYFPGGFQLPEIPQDVQEALGSKYASYAAKRKLPTFDKAGGFAFGGSFHAELEVDMFLWLKASTTLGFDLALLATNGTGCPGYSTIGRNGFYGMGQLYAKFAGEMGLSLNLGFWKGHLTLASASVGALLQGGGPKPTWAYGLLAFKANCLGGLIKINTSVDFSMGHVCIPGNSDPLANVKLFQNVTPAFNSKSDAKKTDNIVSPYTVGTIVSNLPWNEDVMLCADQKYGKGTTTRKFRFILVKDQCSATYTNRANSSSQKTMQLTFSPNNMETNMQYFEWDRGGMPQYSDFTIKLVGRAFEWRPSYTSTDSKKDEINLSQAQRQTDYYYTLYTNNYSMQNTSHNKYPAESRWRDPVFTDTAVTTHKSWTQDTTFYFSTSKLPDNLDNAVVFTWPYNGDPHVPVNELVTIDGRKRVLIYLQQDRDFLKSLDADGREIKAFLLLHGLGINSDALACDYTYHSNGYLGSGSNRPCIEVKLPSDFGSKYEDYDMAVRLMMVKKNDYDATLKQLQEQANASANSMRQQDEVQRRNSGNRERLNAIKESVMGNAKNSNQVSNNNIARNSKGYSKNNTTNNIARNSREVLNNNNATYSMEDLNNNIEYQQLLKSLEEQDFYGEKVGDTNIAFARKMLKNDYAICLKSGAPIYTLYFRLYRGASTYAEVLAQKDQLKYLTMGKEFNKEATVTRRENSMTGSNDYTEAGRFAYLFAPYSPTDKSQYKVGITLPPIIYITLDWNRSRFTTEYELYQTYASRLIDMDNAVKNTYSPTLRPDQKNNKMFELNSGPYPKGWLTNNMGNDAMRSAMKSDVFDIGFVPVAGLTVDNNFVNLGARMNTKSNGYYTSITGNSRASFPKMADNIILAPNIIKIELGQEKWRYDSTSLGSYEPKTIGGVTFQRPEQMYCTKVTTVDEAIPAMFSDIKRYHDFYQDLFDYGLYVHAHGWSYKRWQYEHLMQYAYRQKQFATNNFPYTVTKSTLLTWWMHHWNAIYLAGQKKRANTSWDNMKFQPIPESELTQLIPNSENMRLRGNYWMTYILHWDKVPYMVANDKGTLFGEMFTDEYNNNQKFSRWRTKAWFNGKTAGGGVIEEPSGGLVNVKLDASSRSRGIFITYYYVHGGSNSSDYYIFGKIAQTIRTNGVYEVMANATKQSNHKYNYSISTNAAKHLKENSGITFRALNVKGEECRQKDQWE